MNVLSSTTLPDSFNIDFYVQGETIPRTARVTANGRANNGNDIFIEHQYKALFPTDSGGTQEVLFYKRDGITLPVGDGFVTIDGFDYESGWKIDGNFVSQGATLPVASSGDIDLRGRMVHDIAVVGYKANGSGYTMGFRSDALQSSVNNIIVNTDKAITGIQLPAKPVNLNLSQVSNLAASAVNFYSDSNKTSLSGITLPNTVVSIGENAFRECTNLTSIAMPNTTVSIGVNAFRDCTNLSSIPLPTSVRTIGSSAFDGCSSLSTINLPPALESIGDYAFENTGLTQITIPAGITSIGSDTFSDCTSLQTVSFAPGSQLTSIGSCAFLNCTSLNISGLPSTVNSIGNQAFQNCTSIASFEIPNGVTSLNGTFNGCSNLASITIPSSVNEFLNQPFGNIKPFCELIFNSNGGTISRGASNLPNDAYKVRLAGTGFPVDSNTGLSIFKGSTYLREVVIENIDGVPQQAFLNCGELTSVTLPAGRTYTDPDATIETEAFKGCQRLESINIPPNIKAIKTDAFMSVGELAAAGGCTLTFEFETMMSECSLPDRPYSIVLKDGVPIGSDLNSIFRNSEKLQNVLFKGGNSIPGAAFLGCTMLTQATFEDFPYGSLGSQIFDDNLTTIIFDATLKDLMLGSAEKLVRSSRDFESGFTFWFKNNSEHTITVLSNAFTLNYCYGCESILYKFDNDPTVGVFYVDSLCFRSGMNALSQYYTNGEYSSDGSTISVYWDATSNWQPK